MVNCSGRVPPTVKTLIFTSESKKTFKNIIAPFGMEAIDVTYPLKKYPDSILDLRVHNFVPIAAPPFPKNVRYLFLGAKEIQFELDDHKLPSSVFLLSGAIPEWDLIGFRSFPNWPISIHLTMCMTMSMTYA